MLVTGEVGNNIKLLKKYTVRLDVRQMGLTLKENKVKCAFHIGKYRQERTMLLELLKILK